MAPMLSSAIAILPKNSVQPLFATKLSLWMIAACNAEYAILATRVVERNHPHRDASDADLAVRRRQFDTFQPLSATEKSHQISAQTDKIDVVESTLSAIRARIQTS
jgi:predicted kinase